MKRKDIDDKGHFIDLGDRWDIPVTDKKIHYPSINVKTNVKKEVGSAGIAKIRYTVKSISLRDNKKPDVQLEIKSIDMGKK